jgi:hypothetical protein
MDLAGRPPGVARFFFRCCRRDGIFLPSAGPGGGGGVESCAGHRFRGSLPLDGTSPSRSLDQESVARLRFANNDFDAISSPRSRRLYTMSCSLLFLSFFFFEVL